MFEINVFVYFFTNATSLQFGSSLRKVLDSWNSKTVIWLKYAAYERLPTKYQVGRDWVGQGRGMTRTQGRGVVELGQAVGYGSASTLVHEYLIFYMHYYTLLYYGLCTDA